MALPILSILAPIGSALLGVGGVIGTILGIVWGSMAVIMTMLIGKTAMRLALVGFSVTLMSVLFSTISAAYTEIQSYVIAYEFGGLVFSVVPTSTSACITLAIGVDVARYVYDFSSRIGEKVIKL